MLLDGLRVFIIEDNLENRSIAQLSLEYVGARIAFERWGSHSVQEIYKFMPVDIILLDLMFPNNVTGYDVFTEIRSCPDLEHIPIVAVSAADPADAIALTKQHGFDGFIPKPIDIDVFPKKIHKILNGESMWISR